MTRKQALELAVQALAGNEEAVQVLHTMIDELPLNRWTEAAIRDSVEQFILDHSRVPTATDFKKRGLPPHTVIKKRFGITLQEWLNRDYPVVKPSEEEKRTKATEAFVLDYFRIQPKSADEFNARRARPGRIAGTPSPSATTPAAGAIYWRSWSCRSITTSLSRA